MQQLFKMTLKGVTNMPAVLGLFGAFTSQPVYGLSALQRGWKIPGVKISAF